MSGLVVTTGGISEDSMETALEAMYHRGPDEASLQTTKFCQIGYCHLAIGDASGDMQPVSNRNKTKWLVCDGEILNCEELCTQVQKEGVSIPKAELVLELYEKFGPNLLPKLDGAFALVIVDDEQETLFVARDVFGVKPLYYGKRDGELVFASELKAIYNLTEEAYEFPPGQYYTPEDGFVEYQSIRLPQRGQSIPEDHSVEHTVAKVRTAVERAVHKQLKTTGEDVGALLSGGLDSSLLAAIAGTTYHNQLHSFCVGSPDSLDIPAAREVAKALGTKHHEYIYGEEELITALQDVIFYLESYDPSLVRSAIPTYFVSQLARRHVKVVLSGEGADELFSGYAYLKSMTDMQEVNTELLRILGTAHNINLQRVDRMTMAHSLEVRMPFLDLDLAELAMKIPVSLKIRGEKKMEKWVLREAFRGVLPDSILWRTKAEFSEGSGSVDILENYAAQEISERELRFLQKQNKQIRSKQEALYYRIFQDLYPQPSALETVGHWVTT